VVVVAVASLGKFLSSLVAAIGVLALVNSIRMVARTSLSASACGIKKQRWQLPWEMLTMAIHSVEEIANGPFNDITLVPTHI
jgi:hypothetical protein